MGRFCAMQRAESKAEFLVMKKAPVLLELFALE